MIATRIQYLILQLAFLEYACTNVSLVGNLLPNFPVRASRPVLANSYTIARAHTLTVRKQLASFDILTSAESRDYSRALSQLYEECNVASEGIHNAWQRGSFAMYAHHIDNVKTVTPYALALRIQKIERARNCEADTPKEQSEYNENAYDGTMTTREDVEAEGYLADSDTRHYNYTQLQGTKGRRDNIIRKASFPPRRAATVDLETMQRRAYTMKEGETYSAPIDCGSHGMLKLYQAMTAERSWRLSVPSKEQLVNAEYDRIARQDA